jgi:hypothetical protein
MEAKTINQKLLTFQSKVNAIKKDGKNPHFKSTYATLTQILSEVKPILSEVGLVITQPVNNRSVQTVITDAETGEFIMGEIPLPENQNPQQIGSAITYYRRYLLAGILSLEIEDDDANLASAPTHRAEVNTANEKPWLNMWTTKDKKTLTKEGNGTLTKLANGDVTLEVVKQHYRLSKEVEAYLIENGVNANPIKD